MKKEITVIIYYRINNEVGYSAESEKVWFWANSRKIKQELLWKLLGEVKGEEFIVTNIQIF